MRLFKLNKGDIAVTSMCTYNKQKDVFVEMFRVLDVETYWHMIKRNISRIMGYMIYMDFVGLKKMLHMWSRNVKIEYVGE